MSIRHDWYQSDSKIVITVLLKNANEKNYKVTIERDRIVMTADNYNLELDLFRPIDVNRSTYKATSSKVEITLIKETGERWNSLEKKKDENQKYTGNVANATGPQKWDKLAKEISQQESEEAEGEEALQNLFKKIYCESSEEVRRAMNKSFSESGGTVLSTNWKEVSEKTVEVKPPDGTEYKKWDS